MTTSPSTSPRVRRRLVAMMVLCGLACVITCLESACIGQEASKKPAVRTWKAAAGGYSVEAELVENLAGAVKLKKADGRIITVPVAQLSKEDQEYLKGLAMKPVNPFAGGTPAPVTPAPGAGNLGNGAGKEAGEIAIAAGELQTLPGEGMEIPLNKIDPRALEPDPMPRLLTIKPGTVNIEKTDAYDKPSELAVVDPQTSTVAISLARNVAGRPEETNGKLFLGQLPNGPFRLVSESNESLHLLDHHAGTGQTLVIAKGDIFHRGGELQLLENLASGEPVVRIRRLLPGHDKPGFKPKAEKAWLLAKDVAVVQVNDSLYCWNLAENKLVYRTARNTVNTLRQPSFSGGRRYIALPADKGFHLIESATGDALGFVDANSIASCGVTFHPDGKRIAISSSNAWAVYDCAAAKMIKTGTVAAHLHNRLTGWINDHCFLVDNGSVMDVDAEMVVWSYYAAPSESKRLWNGTLSVVSKLRGLTVQTLPMLDPRAKQAIQELPQLGNVMITEPGTKVRVVISVEDADADELQAALEQAIKNAGWIVDPTANLAVIATIGRGKPYELKYREGARIGAFGGQVHTVKINPFTATLEIRNAGGVLWRRETENHIPRLLFLRGGQTVEQAVKSYEKPQPTFFSSLRIPSRIPKPDVARGLGRSRIDKGQWVDFPFR